MIHRLGQPEVYYLDLSLWRDFDVGRFQVTMDDAAFMGRFQRLSDLDEQRQRFFDRQATTVDPFG